MPVEPEASSREPSLLAVMDVGGTTIGTGAVVKPPASLADVAVGPTLAANAGAGAEEVLASLAAAATTAWACANGPGSAAGLVCAVPGPFDLEGGRPLMEGQAKFDSVHGVDWRRALRDRVELGEAPISFVRDSESVAVGEARFGAGRGAERVLTASLGTGFGSSLTVGGAPVASVDGEPSDELYRRRIDGGRVDDVLSARGLAALAGVDPAEIGQLEPDDVAFAVFGRRLADFLEPVVGEWGIDRVVIAGGLAKAFDRFAAPLDTRVSVPVAPASLGPGAALLGAALLSR